MVVDSLVNWYNGSQRCFLILLQCLRQWKTPGEPELWYTANYYESQWNTRWKLAFRSSDNIGKCSYVSREIPKILWDKISYKGSAEKTETSCIKSIPSTWEENAIECEASFWLATPVLLFCSVLFCSVLLTKIQRTQTVGFQHISWGKLKRSITLKIEQRRQMP